MKHGTSFSVRATITAVVLLAVVLVTALPAPADDVLKFRSTSSDNGGMAYVWWKFSNASRTIQSGDCVEYDVYITNYVTGLGGIDIKNTDGTYWRDMAGWVDQNGVAGHPIASLAPYAYGRWFHRKLAAPAAAIGKTISYWDVATDGDYGANGNMSAQYDNVCITRNNTVVLWAYTTGVPSLNAKDFDNNNVVAYNLFYGPQGRTGTQTAAHFFFWHNSPWSDCDPNIMPYDPHGLPGYPWNGYGVGTAPAGYYNSTNQYWWESEFQDMKQAGIDIASILSWGEGPSPYFRTSTLSTYMVPALERSGVGIKVAMFDSCYSQAAEWNQYWGRGYLAYPDVLTDQNGNPTVPMPLSDSNNWWFFYGGKIRPFFQAIPQKYWATHNGAPIEQGGRPIIILYSGAYFTDINTYGPAMWSTIKALFAQDFRDANGNGITPFIVFENSWVMAAPGLLPADGWYAWGAAYYGPNIRQVGSYYCCEIGPGYDDRLIRSPGLYRDRDDDGQMVRWFNSTPDGVSVWNANVVMMETWNEMWEGTAIDRATDYPFSVGGYLPETYYMDSWRNLLTSTIGRNVVDATFLHTWEIPTAITRGSYLGQIATVRNDGYQVWDTNTVNLAGWLEDANGNMVANSTSFLGFLSSPARMGEQCRAAITVPPTWPTGSYYMRLDLIFSQTGQWFHGYGDTPVRIPVTIN